MKAEELLSLFTQAGKRAHLVGSMNAGIVVALDMEGRIFTLKGGKVLNRVNPKAIMEQGTLAGYPNPGGDALWPAPEGTILGYQYSTGSWRVPPGLRSVRYTIDKVGKKSIAISGEVDLINNKGYGIPTVFRRKLKMTTSKDAVIVHAIDGITYVGDIELKNKDCLLAPWSLCQFDSGPNCEVVFPCSRKSSVWDLYGQHSHYKCEWTKGDCRIVTAGTVRFQVGLDKTIPWIRFIDHKRGLQVRRVTENLPRGQAYIDIRDALPDVMPSKKGVRYSIYSDSDHFMEIESAGGCPKSISPGAEMNIHTTTSFQLQ